VPSTSSRATIHERQLDAVDIFQHLNHHQSERNDAVTEPSLATRQLIQRIASRERWVWGGGFHCHGDFWKTRLEWTNYPLAEELAYHKKNAKINPLEMDLFLA
jgi:hypothetical protein